jgi:Tat protein secretion system quality control protein TatD with DNase activity
MDEVSVDLYVYISIDIAKTTSYIGEIGLDFSREGIATKARQIQSFTSSFESHW